MLEPVFTDTIVEETAPVAVPPPSPAPAPAGQAVRDEYGRDVSNWIDVGGKLKPHP